mgnify:CR=1 FL=1
MNLSSLITDNITELLIKIIKFTKTRQKILTQNISDVHNPGFVPYDLSVDEFTDLLHEAIDEHIHNQRLILRDTENIKFGANGSFKVKPVVDNYAKQLLENNQDEYFQLQINKLLENLLNLRVAIQLLRQRQKMLSTL